MYESTAAAYPRSSKGYAVSGCRAADLARYLPLSVMIVPLIFGVALFGIPYLHVVLDLQFHKPLIICQNPTATPFLHSVYYLVPPLIELSGHDLLSSEHASLVLSKTVGGLCNRQELPLAKVAHLLHSEGDQH
jgi:hypothetical protein